MENTWKNHGKKIDHVKHIEKHGKNTKDLTNTIEFILGRNF